MLVTADVSCWTVFRLKVGLIFYLCRLVYFVRTQSRREGGEPDTDESWSSPDSSDEEEGGPDHVQCMSS